LSTAWRLHVSRTSCPVRALEVPTADSHWPEFDDARRQGDVVAIFPEGGVWKKRNPPIGEFAPGVGKANHIVNEFFRRAKEDPRLDLRIFTALTLGKPRWKSDLERRFVEPLAERLFGGYPELEYVDPLRRGDLPSNIRVTEFYFQAAASSTARSRNSNM
jgi:hypothetical protein